MKGCIYLKDSSINIENMELGPLTCDQFREILDEGVRNKEFNGYILLAE